MNLKETLKSHKKNVEKALKLMEQDVVNKNGGKLGTKTLEFIQNVYNLMWLDIETIKTDDDNFVAIFEINESQFTFKRAIICALFYRRTWEDTLQVLISSLKNILRVINDYLELDEE